ncbi:MAG: alpha/beta hydrolase [Lachnospiraceae bacterium]|nr:alpha/beta hydrolase [Lachnospiraceae bacterium]
MSEISEKIRKNFGSTDAKRDEGLETPETVVRFDDIIYGTDPVWQSLDVYRPVNAGDEKLPVVVSVHGGGWVYGDKSRYQYYCMSLAERGFAVVNFSYRLAPEHKFPAPLEDTCMVFSWIQIHAEKYGFDMAHIFAVGDSAGGHTLALFCVMCTNPDYCSRYIFSPPKDFVPAAVALNCAVHQITVSDKPKDKFSTDLMTDYLEHKGNSEELSLVNVSEWITKEFPPTFLMTAEDDFLKYQIPDIVSVMIQKNVPFAVRYYKAEDEKLGHVFHLDIKNAHARQYNDEECAFFKEYIKSNF